MNANRVEELRQAALAKVRDGELEEAIVFYDQALASVDDEETRELITINKADVLIALERSGPEVQELGRIVMRRRSPRHVFLAAYALQYKTRLEGDFKRALFYGNLALRAAEETNDAAYRSAVLVDIGNVYGLDSQVPKAIECYQAALTLLDAENGSRLNRGYTLENLGYCRLLQGDTDDGIALIHQSLELLDENSGRAEAYVDLCYGYLDKNDPERARFYGEAAMEIAREDRQIRNAHYLLGEAAYQCGDAETAEYHFDHLARFYPQFRNLKSLLYAIDLRGMVNLKL
jgi:tetratricopeptide (TPR) repeat protein